MTSATTPQPSSLMAALLAVQAAAPKLRRDATGQVQSRTYPYTTISSLKEDVGPLLAEHELVWLGLPTTGKDGGPALTYRLTHVPSGEAIEDTVLAGGRLRLAIVRFGDHIHAPLHADRDPRPGPRPRRRRQRRQVPQRPRHPEREPKRNHKRTGRGGASTVGAARERTTEGHDPCPRPSNKRTGRGGASTVGAARERTTEGDDPGPRPSSQAQRRRVRGRDQARRWR